MQGLVVAMLEIGNTLIPYARVLRVIHVQDMHDHLIYNLSFTICLGVEGRGFVHLGV
jgi:hypothetical protein